MPEKSSSPAKLLSSLQELGPQSPGALMSLLGLSQPTLYRAAKALPDKVITLGAPRNRKVAALRPIRGLPSPRTPLFTVSPQGEVEPVGDILALEPSSFVLLAEGASSTPRLYSGLPFFVSDVRPRGFLGSAFARSHPDLNLPPLPEDWSNDQILSAMARRGEDLAGNVLVGAESFERFQRLQQETPELIDAQNPTPAYMSLAKDAESGNFGGSCLGGSYPKFGAALSMGAGGARRVLVKFSPLGDSFAAKRWRDLLVCESLALETLRSHGFETAENRILISEGRTFLELTRFDRMGLHGRKRVLSLLALDAGRVARTESWPAFATMLARDGTITSEDLRKILRLECFGRLIANNDRGPDNISFLWRRGDPTASLAPIYDMLPMQFAPTAAGTDPNQEFTAPTYGPNLIRAWKDTLPIARHFWNTVQVDSRISPEFRAIAEKCGALVEGLS
ncbi:MAG: type II toxin-antitoxin system HipA family toxin YjjJ [Bdellovibrionota bacterium]